MKSALKIACLTVLLGNVLAVAAFAAEYDVLNLRLEAGAWDDTTTIKPYVPYAINDLGQVTGHGYMSNTPYYGSSSDPYNDRAQPFFYDPATGHFVNIGDMGGNINVAGNDGREEIGGNGYAITDDGWVAGRNGDPSDGYYRAMYWKDLNKNGVTDPGEMRDLGIMAGSYYAQAWGMNNQGDVVGTASGGGNWLWKDTNNNDQADAGEMIDLGSYNAPDLNESGYVGLKQGDFSYRWYDDNGDSLIDTEELTQVTNPHNATLGVSLRRVNTSGQVCGYLEYNTREGFLWTDANENDVAEPEEFMLFGDYNTNKNTYVRDMNDVGQVVGGTYAFDGQSRRGFVWDPIKGLRDLNDLIDYSVEGMGDFYISQAEGINNRGQIVALGHFSTVTYWNNDDFGVLLTGPAVQVCQVFLTGQNVTTGLGWETEGLDTDSAIEVTADATETILRLFDEGTTGTDQIAITRNIELGESFDVEFDYRFLTSGTLSLMLGTEVLGTLENTSGEQTGYLSFAQTFVLDTNDVGFQDLTLQLEGVGGAELFLDNIYITTQLGPLTITIPGDANNDGKVDGSDVTILANNWQYGVSGTADATWEMGDFNGDGKVDGSDVTILANNWQYGVAGSAAEVPEPSMLVLILLGLGTLLVTRRSAEVG